MSEAVRVWSDCESVYEMSMKQSEHESEYKSVSMYNESQWTKMVFV